MSSRTALVTGASAGLGLEFCRQLAAAGFNLVMVARRREKLEQLAGQLREQYAIEVMTLSADLSDPGSPREIVDELERAGIGIDFLVNNAGAAGCDLLEDRRWEDQQEFFQLMMLSVAHLCHLFIPPMKARGFGRVINVASVAGRIPRAGGCNYGPSKAYLVEV